MSQLSGLGLFFSFLAHHATFEFFGSTPEWRPEGWWGSQWPQHSQLLRPLQQ